MPARSFLAHRKAEGGLWEMKAFSREWLVMESEAGRLEKDVREKLCFSWNPGSGKLWLTLPGIIEFGAFSLFLLSPSSKMFTSSSQWVERQEGQC